MSTHRASIHACIYMYSVCIYNPPPQFSRLGIQVSCSLLLACFLVVYLFVLWLLDCLSGLGGWEFYFHCLLAGVLCTCTFMYIYLYMYMLVNVWHVVGVQLKSELPTFMCLHANHDSKTWCNTIPHSPLLVFFIVHPNSSLNPFLLFTLNFPPSHIPFLLTSPPPS